MNIADLIALLANRLATLSQMKATFERLGDIPALAQVEADIAETEVTLAALRGL